MLKQMTLAVAPVMVPLLLKLLGATLRLTVSDPHRVLNAQGDRPLLLAFWHHRIVLMPWLYRRYFSGRLPARVMISASRDGQLITDIIRRFDIGTFRGSSSRHAVRALKEMARELRRAPMVLALTPDGPRGPAGRVQPGIIHLAAHTGLPIVPVSYRLSWQWRARSWDRLTVPLPFSRCALTIGEPLTVRIEDDVTAAAAELGRRLGR
ncbi:MAG: lysophospholipid acyltransferase family protein [Verrucomicrobiales bacterium]|nr:lysophospholipid acyltransferase family protein [Verrucomicrobiales bacterium]